MNYQKLGHELMSQDEIAVMDGGKCILRIRGVRPFMSDKYDITQHPQYKYLSDFDKKNEFDIEKYVSTRGHLVVKPEMEVDQVIDLSTLNFTDEPEDGIRPPEEAKSNEAISK
jgi:type IV secretion system protein VirD4